MTKTTKHWRLATAGAAVAIAVSAVLASPAHAADKSLGNITCGSPFPSMHEIHSLSSAKGDVSHEIYGAWQRASAWPVTSNITAGYSSSYASWDVHHWLYYKNESGGRVKGSTGVNSGSLQCR